MREYARTEKLLRQILTAYPDHLSAVALCINLYSKTGRVAEARALFDRTKKPRRSHVLYDAMIQAYGTQEPEKAREVFNLAVTNGQAEFTAYRIIASIYYDLGQFIEVEDVFKNAPGDLGRTPAILKLAEALRKMGKPNEALGIAESFIARWGSKSYSDDTYILARVIRGFCFLKIGKMDDAKIEFASLKVKTPHSSVHYARILCGYVFSNESLPQGEISAIRQVLRHFEEESDGSLKNDIRTVLLKLEHMGSATTIGQSANCANITQPGASRFPIFEH